MTNSCQRALAALREIDASFHRLFEAVENADDPLSTTDEDPITALQRARSQIDAALFEHRRRATEETLPDAGECVLQWNPSGTPPRRLCIEPTSDGAQWTRRELEWTGEEWRVCSRETVDGVAIRTPAEPRYPNPVDPPTLETLLEWIRDGWARPDPPALVFEATLTTEQGVLVAVDDELRYRECDSHRWFPVTKDELSHHLQQQGQPTLRSLSETALTRQHFTPSPLTQ